MVYQILCKIKKAGLEPVVHLVLWGCFIAGEIYSLSLLTGRFSPLEQYVLFYLLNILLFYSYLWLLHKIPQTRPAGLMFALLIFLLEINLYVLLAALVTRLLNGISNQGQLISVLDKKFYVSTIWRGLYFMLFATGYYLVRRHARQREVELEKKVEMEWLKSQLAISDKNFLRAQINPHLFFNTISFIRHAIKHDPANAAVALASLSDIMDYALDNSKRDSVLLIEEVGQIENMISLNRLRFGEKLNLNFSKNIGDPGQEIIPIVLLTIVENVFKHAILSESRCPVKIELTCTSTKLVFKTTNLPSNNFLSKGSQTGLENVKQRLVGSYRSEHQFLYGLIDGLFITELTIDL